MPASYRPTTMEVASPLRDIAARSIIKNQLKYVDVVPRQLEQFIETTVTYLTNPRQIFATPKGEDVSGIACLDDEVFVIRNGKSEVEVYDVSTFATSRRIPVPGLVDPEDMASNNHNKSIYIVDYCRDHASQVDVRTGTISRWLLGAYPRSIFVKINGNILVTLQSKPYVKEFTQDGHFVREFNLGGIEDPRCTVQLPSDMLLMTWTTHTESSLRMIDRTGFVTLAYGGLSGSDIGQMKWPIHVTTDKRGFILVADSGNNRILLLSPSLTYIRELIAGDRGLTDPRSMFLDESRGLLFIGEYTRLGRSRFLVFKVNDSLAGSK